jgi:hypothetical protein
MQELISAANTAGLFRNKVFGRRIADEWALLLVVTVEREGHENTVTAEFVDSRENEKIQFRCQSAEPVLDAGDFVNMKGKEISFVTRRHWSRSRSWTEKRSSFRRQPNLNRRLHLLRTLPLRRRPDRRRSFRNGIKPPTIRGSR